MLFSSYRYAVTELVFSFEIFLNGLIFIPIEMPFYAVKVGKKPGIYNTWDAQAQVIGYSGAVFKKFPTSAEALSFIGGGVSPATLAASVAPPHSYVEGSKASDSLIPIDERLCNCRVPAKRCLVRKEGPNHGKVFFTCQLQQPLLPSSGCKYFEWEISKSSEIVNNLSVTEDTMVIYVDGSCKGNRNVAAGGCPAGWGVVVAWLTPSMKRECDATVVCELFGPVVLDPCSPFFLGAEVGTSLP